MRRNASGPYHSQGAAALDDCTDSMRRIHASSGPKPQVFRCTDLVKCQWQRHKQIKLLDVPFAERCADRAAEVARAA